MSFAAVGIGLGAVTAGTSIAGAAGAFGGSPRPRQAMRLASQGYLNAQNSTSQPLFDLQARMQPQYLALGNQNTNQLLMGHGGALDTAGQLSPQLQDLYQAGASRGVAGNLGLLNQYLPQAQSFYDASNLQLASLRNGLGQRAQQNLALGSQLNPEDAYRITQGVRGDWASRGLGRSMPAGLAEAMQLYGGGEALRAQRTNQAQDIYGQLASTSPDYASFILGLGGNPVGESLNLIQQQQPLAYGRWYDPFTQGGAAGTAQTTMGLDAQQSAQLPDTLGGLSGGLFSLAGSLYKPKNTGGGKT